YRVHTLAASSDLDFDDYYAKAAQFNAHLERRFGWLYERLLRALADHLQCPVALEPRAARPGFHIKRPSEHMLIPEGNRHFDLQFSKIEWAEPDRIDFSSLLSFTLAIQLPQSGAGLHVWSITKTDFDGMDATTRAGLNLTDTVEYVPYHEGRLVCHSGLLLHTSAPSSNLRPDDVRLTLQCHALRRGDTYVFYW